MLKLTIDGQAIETRGGTILEAARAAGIQIPTLCQLAGYHPMGACRVCVVEVEGAKNLPAACSTPVTNGMVVRTNSAKARAARRTVIDLLLSEHQGDCQFCVRNADCELQTLAHQVGLTTLRYEGERPPIRVDASTLALTRDTGKCIKCRRCVIACGEVQQVGAISPQYRGYQTLVGPAFTLDLAGVACVQCGQCAAVCPVGAITEKSHIDLVWQALDDPGKHVIVQTAPAIRAALGECFGYQPGTVVTGKMTSALKRLGFAAVFDTNFAADLTIMEEGTELLKRLKMVLTEAGTARLPLITSCSPGWVKYAETFYHQFLPNLSTCKSPQQMFGALAKTYYANKIGRKPEDIVVVSVMPCTAKKFEAGRPEMNASGVPDVDYVLTTRELAAMIKSAGLDLQRLPSREMDAPLGVSTGAADIFANTGGVAEAALRTVYELVTGQELPVKSLHIKPLAGLQGVKEAALTITATQPEWAFLQGVELRVAVAHGLGNAAALLDRVAAGQADYHFIEIMACPGGCIGGGGQPRLTDDYVRRARISAIYREDERKTLRKSHINPAVQQLYQEFLHEPLSEVSHHLLHTAYTARPPA